MTFLKIITDFVTQLTVTVKKLTILYVNLCRVFQSTRKVNENYLFFDLRCNCYVSCHLINDYNDNL